MRVEHRMTRDEILNMPAGRKMDALIDEYVFKRQVVWERGSPFIYLLGYRESVYPYSKNITSVWDVVEKMGSVDDLHDVDLRTSIRGWVCVIFNSFESFEVNAETAPLAICRAALLATIPLKSGV